MTRLIARLLTALAVLVVAGCGSVPVSDAPLPLAADVDLDRFTGAWYVLGGRLTSFEDGAHNAIEHYARDGETRMATTFAFRRDGFDGPCKRYRPTGFVQPESGNAIWRMQFVWPLRLDYRILELAPDYSRVVIGREARDYVWIMARSPEIDAAAWTELVERIASWGYDPESIRRVPQRWPSPHGVDDPRCPESLVAGGR